jgi:hypothetical protein
MITNFTDVEGGSPVEVAPTKEEFASGVKEVGSEQVAMSLYCATSFARLPMFTILDYRVGETVHHRMRFT